MTNSSQVPASPVAHRPIGPPCYPSFSRKAILIMGGTAVIGGLGAFGGASLYADGSRRVMLAYLVATAYVLSLSLGSLFFVLIQHLTRAGWAVLIRRPAEIFAMNVVTVAFLTLPIVWSAYRGATSIYPWARVSGESASVDKAGHDQAAETFVFASAILTTKQASPRDEQVGRSPDPEHAAGANRLYAHQTFDALTASKTDWLNPPFFTIRLVVYFAVWTSIAAFYFRRSRRQDEVGGDVDTRRMEWWSGLAALAFGVTLTFAAIDLLMSLDPHWYSTIFGVYYFAGCAIGGIAVNLLTWLVLSQTGLAPVKISDAHLRDLGRLLFAFLFFWGYIAFSQYMLLWYANIPETTRWLAVRGASLADGYRNSWGVLLLILLFGQFLFPFLGIMSRHVKSNRKAMIFFSIWMLTMHYLDLVWIVMPELGPRLVFGLPEVGTLVLVGGLYLMGASYLATRTPLVPVGDPRLKFSLAVSDAY